MRILISTDNIGESYLYSLDLANSLLNHGIEVFLVVTGVPLSKEQKLELESFDYAFAEYKQEWMEDPWEDVSGAGEWLLEIKNLVKPDLVHLNSLSFGSLPWDVPVVSVIHSCLISRWMALNSAPPPKNWTKYKQMARAGLRNSLAVVAPSKTMLTTAENIYGPFKNSYVIPHGRSYYSFKSSIKEKYIFTKCQIWDEAENLNSLLKAAPKINYPIYIAGEDFISPKTKLPDNVFFTRHLTKQKWRDWLANAFIFHLPSLYQPFGYTFIDAAFSKCALIGSNIESLRETWQDSMVYARNEEELAYEINDLMDNTEELYLLGQKAFETALENYTLAKMTRHYIQLYQEMLIWQSSNVG